MAVDTLLATKLHIPAARANQVSRTRLVAQLGEGLRLGRKLTLVSAPPGFGKTTLLREWAATAQRRVAWLSVDEEDSDAARFVRYLAAALNGADERLGRSLLRPGPDPTLPDAASPPPGMALRPQQQLAALINELAAVGVEVLLMLDDYHLVTGSAVHDLLVFLLEKQPGNLHVAIGTREDPPLPLARLRARDQVTEIRERALRFTKEEAAAFLQRTMNLSLSAQAVAALEARTEGWITGLQLAGLAVRQQASADEFIAAFAGDDRYIVDYLIAEVLNREPEPVRSFLRQTSILDRLCAPLCDALTGRDDSETMLEQLMGANLFLIPLDNRRQWYRYHVLFADVLRLTLGEQERVTLHRKAAVWLEAHGLGELAEPHRRAATQLTASLGPAAQRLADQPLVEPLSAREIQVLRLIAEGYSNDEIGRKLYISPGTVKTHTKNIYGKLDVRSRTQAIAKGREIGLVA